MTSHERLRERLARLETRGGSGRSENEPSTLGEPVRKSETQRQFRADDGEIDPLALDNVDQIIGAGRIRGDQAGQRFDARVSWRAQDFSNISFLCKPARQSMLACA